MHYVVAQSSIFCGATDFLPKLPFEWATGDIITFSTSIHGFTPLLRFACLVGPAGDGWGIEIDREHIEGLPGGSSRIRARIMHRISRESQTQASIVRMAWELFGGVIWLDSGNFASLEAVDSTVEEILRLGGRPVLRAGEAAQLEATRSEEGRVKWKLFDRAV